MEDVLSTGQLSGTGRLGYLRRIRLWMARHTANRFGSLSSLGSVTAGCASLLCVLWAVTIGNVLYDRAEALKRADQTASALSETYASYATAIASLHAFPVDQYPPLASPAERGQLASFRHTFRLPNGMHMHIVDRQGTSVAGDDIRPNVRSKDLLKRSRPIDGTEMTVQVDYSKRDALSGWRSANVGRGALLAGASLILLILSFFARGIARKRNLAIRRWKALFQHELDCHYVLGVDLSLSAAEWPILDANASGRDLLSKLSQPNALTQSRSCLPVWARDRVASEHALCATGGTSRTYILVSPDRTTSYAVTAVPVPDNRRGPASQLIVRVRDISEREQHDAELEAAIDEAEAASRAKSAILANTSHELRTPLNAIIGYSEMMQTGIGGPLTDKQAEYLQIIHRSGRHLLEIISDILDLAKIESGRFELHEEEVPVRMMIKDCLELLEPLARGKGIKLSAGPITVPPLRVDPVRMRQILVNLLSNAVKFTQRGSVTVEVNRTDTGGICIEVADTGVGMTPGELKLAMEPFRQVESARARQQEGTGLGLPLSKRLTMLHGGTLVVKSTKGVGTSVIVSFGPERVSATPVQQTG